MKNWFNVKNKAGVVDISIHDEIGLYGVNAKDFIDTLDKSASNINISIHSPGGSAFDGMAMYNALKNHPAHVTTKVTGIAASAASIVLMAGDTIEMPEDAFIMIHNPWTFAMGESSDLRDTADMLDKMRDSLVNIYSKKTGIDESELVDMLNNETWLNGTEALDKGFITNLLEPVKVAALSQEFAKHFASVPSELNNKFDAISRISNVTEFENHLREAGGFSIAETKAVIAKSKELFQREVEQPDDNKIETLINNFKQELQNVR